MTAIRRSAALTCAAAMLAGGTAVAVAPTAAAELPDDVRTSPAWDAPMAYPLGGEHNIRFGVLTPCSLMEDGTWEQTLSSNAVDLDQEFGSFDFSASMFPFNSATVEWENLTAGTTGSQTVQTTGGEVGIRDARTGPGDLLVTITVSRSLLPTMAPGSVAPFGSDTHTERFFIENSADCV